MGKGEQPPSNYYRSLVVSPPSPQYFCFFLQKRYCNFLIILRVLAVYLLQRHNILIKADAIFYKLNGLERDYLSDSLMKIIFTTSFGFSTIMKNVVSFTNISTSQLTLAETNIGMSTSSKSDPWVISVLAYQIFLPCHNSRIWQRNLRQQSLWKSGKDFKSQKASKTTINIFCHPILMLYT